MFCLQAHWAKVASSASGVRAHQWLTSGGSGVLLLGHGPLLHGEVVAAGPDHVRVHRGPLHTQQAAMVAPVVTHGLLAQNVPHLSATNRVNIY